jgi:N-acetylglucosamine-6-phosphate deacetylase
MIAVHAPMLFDGEILRREVTVVVEGQRIATLADSPPPGAICERLPEGTILSPGFVDLQVNGGGGVLFNDEPNIDSLRKIAEAHARAGTTALLPTLISAPRPLLDRALHTARDAIAQSVPGIAGLHIEGPFISPARPGIHPRENITTLTDSDVEDLTAPFPGRLLLTLAPETAPAGGIRRLADAGIAVFAGHTDASYEQAVAGLEAGITGFTHIFNAMSQFASRAPGTVGAALDDERAFAGLIVDGYHVHPASMRVAVRALGSRRLFLVSDAMPTAASDIHEFILAGRRIRLADGRLTDDSGTLAGAQLTMADAVRNAVRLLGIGPEDALRMATSTPVRAVRLTGYGTIAPGARADLVALDPELRVIAVWQGGVRL